MRQNGFGNHLSSLNILILSDCIHRASRNCGICSFFILCQNLGSAGPLATFPAPCDQGFCTHSAHKKTSARNHQALASDQGKTPDLELEGDACAATHVALRCAAEAGTSDDVIGDARVDARCITGLPSEGAEGEAHRKVLVAA